MMAVIRGSREGREAITSAEGSGSSWQVDGLDLRMRVDRSEAEGSSKPVSGTRRGESRTNIGGQMDIWGASCW